ncbi:unnamed protein product [Arctogadus glacialis]
MFVWSPAVNRGPPALRLYTLLGLYTLGLYTLSLYTLSLYSLGLYTLSLYTLSLYTLSLYTLSLHPESVHPESLGVQSAWGGGSHSGGTLFTVSRVIQRADEAPVNVMVGVLWASRRSAKPRDGALYVGRWGREERGSYPREQHILGVLYIAQSHLAVFEMMDMVLSEEGDKTPEWRPQHERVVNNWVGGGGKSERREYVMKQDEADEDNS